jgi:ribose transport system permease protein
MLNHELAGINSHDITVSAKKIFNFLLSYGFFVFFVALLIIGGLLSPVFFSYENLLQIIYNLSSILVLASGLTILMITNNMDLSIGSIALMGMSVASLLQKSGASFTTMIIVSLSVGAVCGLINGMLISFLKLNSMLTTLGMQIALRGIALTLTGGGSQFRLLPQFKQMASLNIAGISLISILSLCIMLVFQFILKRTRFGTYCYAVGCNKNAAVNLGLPVKTITIFVFIISGICAAFIGIVTSSKVGIYDRMIGYNLEFDVITVCVIGGTSMLGGVGNIFPGTLLGVLIFYIINNGLALFNASPFIYPFVKGVIIFAAMYIDSLKTLRRK